VTVEDFNCREAVLKPVEVFQLAAPGQPGEDVIDAEQQVLFSKIRGNGSG